MSPRTPSDIPGVPDSPISAERWAVVGPLIDAALDLQPGDRPAYFDRVSAGDTALRAELARLVAECDRDDGLLDRSAAERFASLFDETPPGLLGERFVIERQIGRGGMATVYLARDTKHDRAVAVKVLGPEAGAAIGIERFHREIRVAARLQHAHIVPLYDSGDERGWLYYVMPVMNGGSLRDRLARDGPLDLDVARHIASDIASALAYAHEQGLVHRDIKPENILFDDAGRAMLADFGIAHAATPGDVAVGGAFIGTPAYMSPEQAAGAASVDARSDVYSLAAVVYEMLAGEPRATTSGQAVPSIRSVRADMPIDVDDALRTALAIQPGERFASVRDFIRALTGETITRPDPLPGMRRTLIAASILVVALSGAALMMARGPMSQHPLGQYGAVPSIAVLPLVNASADPGDDRFVDGMTEELIASIASAGGLRVIASTSSFAFAGHRTDVRRIADSLHVANILEGGLLRSGGRIRLTLRLIDATDGSTRWSQAYDRRIDDLSGVDDEVARAVAGALDARLVDHGPRKSPSTEAFDLYLRGSDQRLLRTDSSAHVAVDYFVRAVAADSSFAAAYAGLARSYGVVCQGSEPLRQRRGACDSAFVAAKHAIALDSSLADGYVELSHARMVFLDLAGAAVAVRRAVAIDPNNEEAHVDLALVDHWFGRDDEALLEARRALDLDPLSVVAIAEMARALFFVRREDEALARLAPLRALRPPVRRVRMIVGRIYEYKKMWPEAMTEYGGPARTGNAIRPELLGRVLAESGQRAEANTILSELTTQWMSGKGRAWDVASVYIGLHDYDKAFVWVERAIDDRTLRIDIMDPALDEFRADSRFAHVRERLLAPRIDVTR